MTKLVLLSGQRPSSKYRQTIHRDEADAFLHGYLALWHPYLIAQAEEPPTLGTQEEFENIEGKHFFIFPETPYQYHPTEWQTEKQSAGSPVVRAVPSWQETIKNIAEALAVDADTWWTDKCDAFAGLGLGYLTLEAYCDAQDHANPLDKINFFNTVRSAATSNDTEEQNRHLGQAAHQLHEAREVVNPSQLYQAVTLFLTGSTEESMLSEWIEKDIQCTLVSSTDWLNQWAQKFPEASAKLKTQLQEGKKEWWTGIAKEQCDALLPMSAWLENLQQGMTEKLKWMKKPIESAGRCRYAGTPTLPTLMHAFGIKRTLGFSNDAGVWPSPSNSLIGWRGPEGELLESCCKKPEPLDLSETAFHLGHLLYEAGHAEYVAWIHLGILQGKLELPLWFRCWRALHQLAPVFGHLGSLEQTISDIPATEQFTPASGDDYQSDYLLELTGHSDSAAEPNAISRFAEAARTWRAWEAARTFHAMHVGITPTLANSGDSSATLLERTQQLSQRLAKKDAAKSPGYLLLNPCSFARKVVVNLATATTLLPNPAYSSQKAEQGIHAVIELPPCGYAWVPLAVAKGDKIRLPKQNIIDGQRLRNEYVQLDIDPQTGGLRAIRDAVREQPRLGQQLVYAPGSTMQCDEIVVLKNGLALGELETRGRILDAHGNTLASFRQTYRLAAGRKYAEITIHLEPSQPLQGYPWHAYYGVRWAWRDMQSRMNKSVHQSKLSSLQTRPETPGFIEIENSLGRVAIFSGGLPFWQRHGSRMLDSILAVEGEQTTTFRFALSVDDELPHITEQDWLTPVEPQLVETTPASVSGWLFHLDAPSVMLLDMHVPETSPNKSIVRLIETFGYATEALLQTPRPVRSAQTVNALGDVKRSLTVTNEGVMLHLGCYELQHIQLEW
jgi:predicted RNA-binding Zn ribbon-like protein